MGDYTYVGSDPAAQITGTFVQPKFVGAWEMGGPTGFKFHITKRPRWITRVMMKWLLEWEWVDSTVSDPQQPPPDKP